MVSPRAASNAKDVQVSVETLTPQLAKQLLGTNKRNRNVSKENRAFLTRAIKNGEFILTGETIKISSTGDLIDGQHRCWAVIDSGISVPVIIVRGLDQSAQFVIDTGKTRSAAEALVLDKGTTNAATIASTARLGILWKEGVFINLGNGRGGKYRRISNPEVLTWVNVHDDIHESVRIGRQLSKSSPVTPATASFTALMFRAIDADATEEFYDLIANMKTKGAGDPINTLLRRYQTARSRSERMESKHHLFMLIRTWNAWRNGEEFHRLHITPGTEMPIPI